MHYMQFIQLVYCYFLLQNEEPSAAAVGGVAAPSATKPEARGNGPLPGGGGLMEEMSALLARRYQHTPWCHFKHRQSRCISGTM